MIFTILIQIIVPVFLENLMGPGLKVRKNRSRSVFNAYLCSIQVPFGIYLVWHSVSYNSTAIRTIESLLSNCSVGSNLKSLPYS